jgi:hypothetical protein
MKEVQKVMTTVLSDLKECNCWKCFISWKQHWNSWRKEPFCRHIQFRIEFNTVLPVSTLSLFICQTSYMRKYCDGGKTQARDFDGYAPH